MNSSVIIVGSGASMLGQNKGKKIDSFDHVYRPINCFLFDKNWSWKTDTGTKTTCTWVTYEYLHRLHHIPNNVDVLFMFNDSDSYQEPLNRFTIGNWPSKTNRYLFDIVSNSIESKYFITRNNLLRCNANLKIKYTKENIKKSLRASSGIQVINYALEKFDKVFVIGFDHFTLGWYFNRKQNKTLTQTHNYFLEACYFKTLLKEKKIFSL